MNDKAVESQIVLSNVGSEIVETGIREYDVSTEIREYDVRELKGGNLPAFCSVKAETMEDKALVFNAANNPQHKVADFINKKIMLRDVYAETLEMLNWRPANWRRRRASSSSTTREKLTNAFPLVCSLLLRS